MLSLMTTTTQKKKKKKLTHTHIHTEHRKQKEKTMEPSKNQRKKKKILKAFPRRIFNMLGILFKGDWFLKMKTPNLKGSHLCALFFSQSFNSSGTDNDKGGLFLGRDKQKIRFSCFWNAHWYAQCIHHSSTLTLAHSIMCRHDQRAFCSWIHSKVSFKSNITNKNNSKISTREHYAMPCSNV